MKKLLLNLALLCSAWLNAQGFDNPVYVANFSGNINQGVIGITNALTLGSNVTYVNDKFGNTNSAISVNSNTSSQILPGAAEAMSSNFTVGFWYKKSTTVNTNSTLNHKPFFIVPNTSTGSYAEGTFLSISNDETKLVFGNVNNNPLNNSRDEITFITAGINISQWNYYTLVRDNGFLKLYINGSLKKFISDIPNYSTVNATNSIHLGGYTVSGQVGYCPGSFDNLRVYNRVLTTADINNLYAFENGDSLRSAIKAKYDFNEGALAQDTHGNFHGIVVDNPQLATDRFGNPNSALRVSGTGGAQGIKIPYLNDYIAQKGTIAFWVKPENAAQIQIGPIVHLPNERRQSNTNIYINNNILVGCNNGNLYANSSTAPLEFTNFSMGTASQDWQHVAVTFDNNVLKTYINGTLNGTNTIEGGTARRNGGAQYITIGHSDFYNLEYLFNGLIDDVIIENIVYNPSQIRALADISGAEINVTDAMYIANFSGNLNAGTKGNTFAITATNTITLTADRNDNENYAVRATAQGDLVTLKGAATALTDNTSDYTIGFWYKRNASIGKTGTVSHRPFFSIPNASTTGWGEGLYLGLNNTEDQFVYGYIYSSGSGSGTNNSNNTNVPTDIILTNWNYYTIVKSGNTLNFYVNDLLIGTKAVQQFGAINSDNSIQLGGFKNTTNNGYAPGYYDNLRVYNYALSDQKRSDLLTYEYSEGSRPSIKAKYEFNQNSITTDTFGNFNAIAVNNPQLGTDRHGNPNSALQVSTDQNFNGIRIPYLNEYFGKNNGTIAFWFKADYTDSNPISSFIPIVYLPNQGTMTYKNALAAGYTNIGGDNAFIASSAKSNNQAINAVKNYASVGNWQHCAVTFNNDIMKLYINGVPVATATIDPFPTRVHGGGQDITVGFANYMNINTQFNGLIDDLLFDSVTYTNDEIAALYQTLALEDNQISSVTLYPNPATNVLNVTKQADIITIYDIAGRTIMNAKNTSEVNISELSKGNYIVKIEIDGNVSTQKFIKK
jgi:hypothetical protein